MIKSLLFVIYRFLIMPVGLCLLLIFVAPFNRKVRAGVKMRLFQNGKSPWSSLPRETKPVWFHCSSGEFEYAKPVIRGLKEQYPHIPILVTYFTASYKKQIENSPLVDFSCPLPWDLPGPFNAFLKHHRPRALMIARAELWPEMLLQCKRTKLPILLFSAPRNELRLLEKIFLPITRWLYKQPTEIYAVSEEDQKHFLKVSNSLQVSVKGDTRYDQVHWRIKNGNNLKQDLFLNINDNSIFVAGSTWTEDERVILPVLLEKHKTGKLKLLIAPHDPTAHHIDHLIQKITEANLTYELYSTVKTWNPQNVLIIDRVGVLAEIYPYAQGAFIGGSFKKDVHSVMEALVAGNTVFIGPKYLTNPEAIKFKNCKLSGETSHLNFINISEDQIEFDAQIDQYTKNKDQSQRWNQEIKEALSKEKGASQDVINWLKPHLNSPT